MGQTISSNSSQVFKRTDILNASIVTIKKYKCIQQITVTCFDVSYQSTFNTRYCNVYCKGICLTQTLSYPSTLPIRLILTAYLF